MPDLPDDSIFISYSRRDGDVMNKIVLFLRDQGFKVWVDNERLIPGTPIWEEEIEKAIKACGTVLIIMSPDSKSSEWVRREISLADQYRKHIMPVLARGDEDSSITLRLVTRQFVDLRNDETRGLTSLHNALVEHRGKMHEQMEERSNAFKDATTMNLTNDILVSEAAKPLYSSTMNQSLPWFAIGWAAAGFIAGFIYSSDVATEMIAGMIGSAIGGAIGGFLLSISLRSRNIPAHRKNTFRTTLAWAIGGAIGWGIGRYLTEASGAGIGMAIFPLIGLAGARGMEYVLSRWKSTVVIVLAWAVSSAIGWTISRTFLIDTVDADKATSWAIGTAIAWAIGGFVTSQQVFQTQK